MIVTVNNTSKDINWMATGKERIIQNVLNILRTRQFEVPFMRDLGINPDFVDSPPNGIKASIQSHVIEAINAGESRVEVLDVQIDSCDENGNYEITVTLEV